MFTVGEDEKNFYKRMEETQSSKLKQSKLICVRVCVHACVSVSHVMMMVMKCSEG